MRPSTFFSRMGFLAIKPGPCCAATEPQARTRPQKNSVAVRFPHEISAFGEGFLLESVLYSLRHTIIPYLRRFQSGRRHAGVQARAKENSGAHANGRRDVCPQRIVVRVILLDHADKPLAAEGINSLALRIEIYVVTRSPHRDPRDLFAGIGIKYDQQWRSPGDDKKAMIVFIESHRIVCFGSVQPPLRQGAGFPVDYIHYTTVVRHVDENARALLF